MPWAWQKHLDRRREDTTAWEAYPGETGAKIDAKKLAGVQVFEINDSYSIDLEQMIQFKTNDPHRQRPIKELDSDTLDPERVDSMKLQQLKSALEERGLAQTGTKEKLQERLKDALLKGSTKKTCRVYNSTGGDIKNTWDVAIGSERVDGSTSYSFFHQTEAGAYMDIELPRTAEIFDFHPKNPKKKRTIKIKEHYLKIGKEGFVVLTDGESKSSESKKQVLRPGKTYRVTLDAKNPPLTEQDYLKASTLLRSVVEGFSPKPAPSTEGFGTESKTIPEAWRWIVGELGRNDKDDEVVRKVMKMVTDGSCSGSGRVNWYDTWLQHPHKPKLESCSLDSLLDALKPSQSRYSIVVYHRALGRFPGGNADMHVIKHILNFNPTSTIRNAASRSSNRGLELKCVNFVNWDGSSNITKPYSVPGSAVEELNNKLLPDILRLLKSTRNPVLDFEITVDDEKDYSDYDTKWSSIEILVYINNPSKKLVARIHRRAYLTENPGNSERRPPNPSVEKIFTTLESILKIGTVEQHSENGFGDREKEVESSDLEWHGYHMPVYLAAGEDSSDTAKK